MNWFFEDISVSRWILILILIYVIPMQFLLSAIIGKLLGERELGRRRTSDSVKKVTSYTSQCQNEDDYNPIHPITITHLLKNNASHERTNKPKKESQNKQGILASLGHLYHPSQILRKTLQAVKKSTKP